MHPLDEWFLHRFTADGTRLPAATSASGGEAVTADQRLLDVGLLALVALETGDADPIAQARQALDRFAADGKDVPPSLLDVTGAVHPLGGVVNGFDLAVWGLGVRALNADDKSARRALGLLESVGWSENFTKTGDVLATERRLATAAAGVLLAVRIGEVAPVEALELFWDGARFWDRVDAAGTTSRALGSTTHDLSWALMACRALANGNDAGSEWQRRADSIVTLLRDAVLPQAWHPGVWSRLGPDGRVSMSPEAAFARGDFSPFPAVLASDQALLLVALRGLDSEEAGALLDAGTALYPHLSEPNITFVGPMTRPTPENVDHAQVRRDLGLGSGPLVVASVGGTTMFMENKQNAVQTYRAAFARLREDHPDAEIVLIGRGTTGIDDDGVHTLDYVPDWMPLLTCASALIAQPGWITVTEIAALGVPTIFVRGGRGEYHEVEALRRLDALGFPTSIEPTAEALHDLLEDAVAGRLADRCAKALTALAPSGDRASEAAAKLIAQVAP